MHYTEQIYRPPSEARSVLLEVTTGCSHNQCTFCNAAKGLMFRPSPIEQILEDVKEIAAFAPETKRIHMLSHDAFALSYDRLMEIADIIHEYLPNTAELSTMGGILNVMDKTDEQLKELRKAGYEYIYIGTESGLDEVLQKTRKGFTVKDSLEQLKRLEDAGIRYCAMYVLGLAGKGNGERNALATADLFNQLHPAMIGGNSLTVFRDAPIYKEVLSGEFVEATELECAQELKIFLEHLECPTYLAASHASVGTPVKGRIPRDKEKMLAQLEEYISNFDEKRYRLRRELMRTM